MSLEPSTPNRKTPMESASRTHVQFGSALPLEQLYLYEPSPASTYGDTAPSDSAPVTPAPASNDKSPGKVVIPIKYEHRPIRGRRATGLDHTVGSYAQGDPFAESPKGYRNSGDEPATPSRHHQHGKVSTPNQLRPVTPLIRTPHGPGVQRLGLPFNGNGGSPMLTLSPSKQSNEGFASTPTRKGDGSAGWLACKTRNGGNATNEASQLPIVPSDSIKEGDTTPTNSKEIEADTISDEDAQAMYPPSACVFVANLCATRSDDQIYTSVANAFGEYGKVFVKVRRDNSGMPFAFCQYTIDEDAAKAIAEGRGRMLDGRPCRTECAKVHRAVYMTRTNGGVISESQAREELKSFGPIEKIWCASDTDQQMYQLPVGIWVKFAFFEHCRDAQAAYRDNLKYRLQTPPHPDGARSGLGNRGRSPPARALRRVSPSIRVDKGGNVEVWSIWVGNLSPLASSSDLTDIFSHYGHPFSIDMVSRPSPAGPSQFAFVDFTREQSANEAIRAEHGRLVHGRQIRVEPKESSVTHTYKNYACPRASQTPITETHLVSPRGNRHVHTRYFPGTYYYNDNALNARHAVADTRQHQRLGEIQHQSSPFPAGVVPEYYGALNNSIGLLYAGSQGGVLVNGSNPLPHQQQYHAMPAMHFNPSIHQPFYSTHFNNTPANMQATNYPAIYGQPGQPGLINGASYQVPSTHSQSGSPAGKQSHHL